METDAKQSLASRALGSSAWTVGTRFATKAIDLVMLLCLARILNPADFGLVATAMAAVYIVEALFELPTGAALLRSPTLSLEMLNTAFTLSVLRGLAISLLLVAASFFIARFNAEPRLIALLSLLALAPALRGLANPRMVEYARALNFRPDAAIELVGKISALALALTIAVTTHSYWAIAAATICAPLVSTLLSYCIAPTRLRFSLAQWHLFADMISWNFVSQIGAALNWQIDRLLLPRIVPASAFGQYSIAKQLCEIPVQVLIQPIFRQTVSALAPETDARARRYNQLNHAVALIVLPVMAVPALIPESLVRVLLGPAWLGAAEWLRWMSLMSILWLPGVLFGVLTMAMDRTRWLAARTLIELAIRLPLTWLGATHYGLMGAIGANAIATACGTLTALLIARSLTGATLLSQALTLWGPLIALVPAGAVLGTARPALELCSSTLETAIFLAPLVAIFFVVYALAALGLWRLSGSPAGLEQHLVLHLRKRLFRMKSNAAARQAVGR